MATRWAICGTGNIANDFCVSLKMRPESEHKIVAVASRTVEKAAKFAERFGIPQSFGTYEEMSSIENVDIVYIATVTSAHVENSLLFINAGKNVLCETPMALSVEGCKKVLNAAREKGVFFLEGFWTLFNPVYDVIRETLKSGALGEVRMVQTNCSLQMNDFDVPRMYQLSLGGGMFMEAAGYQTRVANLIFGDSKVESVVSDLTRFKSGDADSNGAYILRYSGGRYAVMSVTGDTNIEENFLVVRGTKGTLTIPDSFWCPTSVKLPNGEVKEFPLPGEIPEGIAPMYANCQLFKYEQEAVRDALLKGLKECPLAPWSDSEACFPTLMKVLEQNNIKYNSL